MYWNSQVEMPIKISPSFYTHCRFLRFACFICFASLKCVVCLRYRACLRGFSGLHEVALLVSEVRGLRALSCLPWKAVLRLNFMLVIEKVSDYRKKKKNICKAVIFSATFFYKRIQMTIRTHFGLLFFFSVLFVLVFFLRAVLQLSNFLQGYRFISRSL